MNLFELFVKIGVDDQASKNISKIRAGLEKGLSKAAKIGTSSIVSLGAAAIKTFADFEQLAGGAELMFGNAFESVMKNAKNAYKTVQMSQNEYLQQVNGFATGLKTSLGGNEKAAADLAHRIVQAEADIVAATGNTQENVQNAFNGIMKSNFTMLDNLQIGITPTKEGFQEVIDKVNDWNAAMGNARNYQMGNLADMQSALVDYIEMVGMSGYAQNEATGTILGSFASMKSAASDFATSLIDENGDVGASWDNLKETVGAFVDNLKPKIMEFLGAISPIATTVSGITGAFVAFKAAASISALIGTLVASFQAYQKANEGATIAQWAMNAAMNANPIALIVTLIGGLVAALVTLWNTNDNFKNALIGAWGEIKNAAVVVWESIVEFFTEDIPNAFNVVINFVKDNWQSLLLLITNPIAGALKLLYDLNPKFKGWVDDLLGKIRSWIGGIVSIGEDIVDGLKTGISDAWSGLKTAISNMWTNIKNVFSGAYTSFSSIGLNIVSGIKAGISNAWTNLKTWFKSLFGDLTGIAKKILGIASPSKVFKSIGAFTAEGFGIGFENEFDHVKKEMENALTFDIAKVGISSSIKNYHGIGFNDGIMRGSVSITQNIYSEAKTAADLMQEALYHQERAVLLGV